MVYMEPAALGISPLVHQWKFSIPPKVSASAKISKFLSIMFDDIIYPSIEFV